MQFALPPKRDGKVPSYATSRTSARRYYLRRGRLRQLGIIIGIGLLFIYLVSHLRTKSKSKPTTPKLYRHSYELEDDSFVERNLPHNTPRVVIVTPIDSQYGKEYGDMIIANRKNYAALHGYDVFTPDLFKYDTYIPGLVRTWSRIPSMRDALNQFPHTPWFLYLEQHALIMNSSISISQITSPSYLSQLLLPDIPIVPPDSVIRSLDLRGESHKINLLIARDTHGLAHSSFLLRRGEWAKYFLDAWFDPLYRSYNFARAEGNALEHLIQWHRTILFQVGIVPQRILGGYWGPGADLNTTGTEALKQWPGHGATDDNNVHNIKRDGPAADLAARDAEKEGETSQQYQEGDFIAIARGCELTTVNSCQDTIGQLHDRLLQLEALASRHSSNS